MPPFEQRKRPGNVNASPNELRLFAMDLRTRFRRVMEYQKVASVPLLEEGLRDDVLEKWRDQGMPAGGPGGVFHYDRRERISVALGLRPHTARGIVQRDELAAWRRSLDGPLDERLGSDWAQRVESWRQREHLLEMCVHSGIFETMGVGDGASLEAFIYLLADEPEVVQEAMSLQGELTRRLTERVLQDVELDMLSFSEPIGDNHGPLLGPATYRSFALNTYRPVLELACRAGVPALVFMTYANAHCLLPEVLAAGFNTLWAMETETTAMDYRRLRREFGRALRFIGGIDLDVLLAGEAAIEREMHDRVPELVAMGGCIPLADGRVRATMTWQAYAHYRTMLERMLQH